MKTFVPVLALAAGVSATFRGAPPFTCPGNTDNKCTDKQKPGFSWDDLDLGDFFQYGDFGFNGWKCEDGGDKRGRFAPRTFGKKVIGGTCTSDRKKSPSFGCGPAVNKFSLGSIHVRPEFDCDLEFHYDMPDGSTCKHRNFCRKSGTTVVNRQCGGAKNVTIVYPPQPNKPKPSCSIQVPTISFDCSTASSTKPPKTKTSKSATTATTTTTPATTTTTAPAETTTTSVKPSQSTPTETSTTSVKPSQSSPAETTTTSVKPSQSSPTETTTTSVKPSQPNPSETTTTSVKPSQSTPTETTTTSVKPSQSSPTGTSTSPANPSSDSTSAPTPTNPPVTKTITTSYDSTSTIFTTSTQTITQCGPTVPNCPGNSVVTTVVTVPVSTTICPVTETKTTIVSTSVPATAPTSVPSAVVTSTPVAGGSSSSGIVTSVKPVETLPCPSVVPSCLNTFLFTIGCDDNTDAACYCPDATFVKSVYDCLYAHGDTDAIIAEAVAYFQGICGKWVGENPAVATGATVTTYITVTAAPTVAPVYTTVLVDVTTVVPCTNDAGEIIPSSSTTVTVSTSMTVPQVGFTTGSTGGVDVIPITAAPIISGAPSTPAASTTFAVPTGTGSFRPTASGPVIAGVGRVGASLGLAAAVAFAAAAL